MARIKITVYVTPDVADTLKRLAATDNRSMSDLIENAVTHRLLDMGREADHAVLVAKLDQMTRRLGVIEKGVESNFELMAHAARFSMSVAPDISDAQMPAVSARGAERFRSVLAAIAARLSSGRSFWRESLAGVHYGSGEPTNEIAGSTVAAE